MNTTIIYQPTTFETINDVKIANKKLGHNWFDAGSMRLFNTNIYGTDKLINKRLLISSEQFISSSGAADPRMFTIRVALPNGAVETVGDFNEYETRSQAIAAAHKL